MASRGRFWGMLLANIEKYDLFADEPNLKQQVMAPAAIFRLGMKSANYHRRYRRVFPSNVNVFVGLCQHCCCFRLFYHSMKTGFQHDQTPIKKSACQIALVLFNHLSGGFLKRERLPSCCIFFRDCWFSQLRNMAKWLFLITQIFFDRSCYCY